MAMENGLPVTLLPVVPLVLALSFSSTIWASSCSETHHGALKSNAPQVLPSLQ